MWKNGTHSVIDGDQIRKGVNGNEVRWAGEWKKFDQIIISGIGD